MTTMIYSYYLTYLIITGVQLFFVCRNALVLVLALRWGSSFMVATLFVFVINARDFLELWMSLRGTYSPDLNAMVSLLFWFGLKNVVLLWYWVKSFYYLYLTKQRCDHE
jgi:hypothetical protein